MEYLVAVVQGLIQGLTEFLPVSSSGHLALANLIFGHDLAGGVSYSFLLHVATFVAACVYFRKDIKELIICWTICLHRPQNEGEGIAQGRPRPRATGFSSLRLKHTHMAHQRRLFFMLIVACVVTGPIGLLLEPRLDFMSSSLVWLACGFFATTVVLSFAELLTHTRQKGRLSDLTFAKAGIIGLLQGLAVLPGLSRSGATISGGMFGGLRKDEATRFAFLVGLPIILMGALKDGIALLKGSVTLPAAGVCLVGFLVAGLSGYGAISWMISSLKKVRLYWFALYTAVLGSVLLVLASIGR